MIEDTEEYKQWLKKLYKLNKHINSLTIWNEYAESQQREYDFLLSQDPRLKNDS